MINTKAILFFESYPKKDIKTGTTISPPPTPTAYSIPTMKRINTLHASSIKVIGNRFLH